MLEKTDSGPIHSAPYQAETMGREVKDQHKVQILAVDVIDPVKTVW